MHHGIINVLLYHYIFQVFAEDLDSPSNGHIIFSIINGDQENQFAVDPVLGLIKVKDKLDRERVSLKKY